VTTRTLGDTDELPVLDKREELPKKIVKAIVDWRKHKGEVEYHNGVIFTTDAPFACDELYRRDIINERQLWAAEAMTRIHSAAFLSVGYRRMREIVAEITGIEPSSDLAPMDIFVRVMRNLTRWQANLVERICWGTVRPNDYAWLYHCRASVQQSLDAAADQLHILLDPPENPSPEES
jgi:hypothetical protein